MHRFCCKCGKTEEESPIVDGFCLSCYKREFPLIISFPESKLNITLCKRCGDLLYNGKWRETFTETKAVIHEIIDEFIAKTKRIPGTKKILVSDFKEPSNKGASNQLLTIIFEGTPSDAVPSYQQEVQIELVANLGICERCAKLVRGYYEAIVQIRSDRRPLSEKEQIIISDLIKQKKMEVRGLDRMAYISKMIDQQKGGLDLYIGSNTFAKAIVNLLASKLAATIEYSYKLKTVRDGKPVHQETYCVRLPYFEIGDIIHFQKDYYQIEGVNNGRLMLFNLKNHESKMLSVKESQSNNVQLKKKRNFLEKYIIMVMQPTFTTIMHTSTYKTIDIESKYILNNHKEGDEIFIIELDQGFFECKNI